MAGTLPLSTDGLLLIPGLEGCRGVVHGFSTLRLGSMRGEGSHASTPARAALVSALGLQPEHLSVLGAVHGRKVGRVDRPSGVVSGCDGLVTDRASLPLLATFADCYPVLLFDAARPALALVHAGWRGTAAGVAGEALARMELEYGSRPSQLVACLGPGICGRCYEVGEDVAAAFSPAHLSPGREQGRQLLDLRSALRAQLLEAGVPADRIHDLPICTKETPELASHRRSPDGTRCACVAALVP